MSTSEPINALNPGGGAVRDGGSSVLPVGRIGLGWAAAALTAAVVAWAVGETPAVRVAPEMVDMVTLGKHHKATSAQTEVAAIVTTTARSGGVFGALLGLASGAATGLARRSQRGAVRAALIGACLGAIVGGGLSYAGSPLYYRFRETFTNDLIPSFLLHGTVGAAIGAVAGLATGLGAAAPARRLFPYVLGGAVGAAIGAVVFVCLGAVFFAGDQTGGPISTTATSRLAARLTVALVFALGVMTTLHERRPAGQPALPG